MELGLEAIRNDEGRPTVHARNMFHAAIAMYDAWAVYDEEADTYLLGKELNGFKCPFDSTFKPISANIDSLREIAMAYAGYFVFRDRFEFYGSKHRTIDRLIDGFDSLGYNPQYRRTNYMGGKPEDLGYYIAECVREYGMQDGARQEENHESRYYDPRNPPLYPNRPGTDIKFVNRWQPISIREYVNQRGFEPDLTDWNINLLPIDMDIFLTPEWGEVGPFSLTADDRFTSTANGYPQYVYLDPGKPPFLDPNTKVLNPASEEYKWNFLLVALWSGFQDPSSDLKIDISPGAIGEALKLPTEYEDYHEYYDLIHGGTQNTTFKKNPKTGKPYEPNIVPMGDYTRVIAEYWVDGINTYTPPGHWVKILHDVSYHDDFSRKWKGKGKPMGQLEWDVKAHLALCGGLHDAGIAAWSVKSWYDYVRPISAIRLMGQLGQSSDSTQKNYDPAGLPIIDGRIEVVTKNDPLAGENGEHIGKMKIYCWRGPDYVKDVKEDFAGVGWILVENWWPYQRYSSSTPPFAGYVSGHSCFSICAADVMTAITGDPYFPDGLAEFTARKDEFLLFEKGPSQDITLQWATYRNAAEETCLSRIFGGIHPPADDIQGRLMGEIIAKKAVEFSERYFEGKAER